jgi:cytochrome c oxidase subunit 2
MPSWYIQQASTYAADVDNLIILIAVIVGVWFVAAELIFFWLLWKFRAKDGVRASYIAGESKGEKKWVSYPHYAVLVFDVIILVFALQVWNDIKITAPPGEERVRVIAQQWAWTFVHAGPDNTLDTADDIRTVEDLHVQVNRTYHFELHSRDVVHSFSVPVFRLKQDVIPGRSIQGWFTPTQTGSFDVQCAEICGIGHGLMPGRIHVRTAAEHQAWMTGAAGTGLAPAAAQAPAGDVPAQVTAALVQTGATE